MVVLLRYALLLRSTAPHRRGHAGTGTMEAVMQLRRYAAATSILRGKTALHSYYGCCDCYWTQANRIESVLRDGQDSSEVPNYSHTPISARQW